MRKAFIDNKLKESKDAIHFKPLHCFSLWHLP